MGCDDTSPCIYGHAWVAVYRWRWRVGLRKFRWFPYRYRFEKCWDCAAERHQRRLPV